MGAAAARPTFSHKYCELHNWWVMNIVALTIPAISVPFQPANVTGVSNKSNSRLEAFSHSTASLQPSILQELGVLDAWILHCSVSWL